MAVSLHTHLLNLFIEKGGFFNKDLIIKKNVNKGFGIFAKNDISPDTILIDVPHNLLIPVNEIKNITQSRNSFQQVFFETVTSNNDYFNYHPLMSNDFELNIINNVLKKNVNLNKNFLIKHKIFSHLAEEKKKIELLSFTRAIFIKEHNKKFFMPIMDFVNYHYKGLRYSVGKNNNIYLKSIKHIKQNEEVLINYTQSTDAISFFFEQGFIDNSFNSFKIKKNELKIKIKTISTFNEKYFSKENDIYTFKEDILFDENTYSQSLLKFLEIFPLNERQKMMVKILTMYKCSISTNSIDKSLEKDSEIIKKFFMSVELYTNIIDNYLELVTKKNEKN